MFLNIPPNDYNLDETLNSLYYGSRVKCITNEQSKNCETKDIAKLKGNYQKLFEEYENLKIGVKKYISGKDLSSLDSNSFAFVNKSMDSRSLSEHITGNVLQNYNSLI